MKSSIESKYDSFIPNKIQIKYAKSGFSKRIEVGVSIYKVGEELNAGGTNRVPQAEVEESLREGNPPLW